MLRFARRGALVLALLCLPATVLAQLTVTGRVVDEQGNPLPGVNVVVEGTTLGAATDMDGSYRVLIPGPDGPTTLVVRYLGYQTARQTVTQQSGTATADFNLRPDILGLSEVVVTGTSGDTEKRQLGNSISTVSTEDIAQSGATDVTAALSGKVTGALVSQTSGSPAGGISVKLRGNSTINSDAEPLYIIDGVIVDNSSPELVEVGSGGVQNRLVDLNPADIDRIEVIKGAAAAAIYGSRASNGVIQIFTKRGRSGTPQLTYSSKLMYSEVRETVRVNEAPYEWVDPTDNSNLEKVPVERFDYQDDVFQEALGTENFLSISGGNEAVNYYLSGSYFLNEGIIRNQDYNRNSLRANVGVTLTDWALVTVGTAFTNSFSNDVPTGGPNFFDGAITTLQFIPHTVSAQPNELGEYPAPGNPFFGNPIEVIERYQFTQEVNRFTGSVNLALTPYPGLAVDAVLGYDTFTQTARGFKPLGTVAQPNGFSSRGDLTKKLFNADLNVRYQAQLAELISSTTSAGGTLQYDESEAIANSATNLGPIVETVDGGTITSSSDFISQRTLQGAFLQQTFGYADRVFLTIAGRVDASSVFGEDERVQFYPKVSGSYVLSDEDFWQTSLGETLDLFKLRASWGQSGNLTGIGPYERFTNYNPVAFGGQTGLVPSINLGNPDIKPETQTEWEVGVDLSLLNRIGLEITYYDQTIDDLLLPRTLSPSTGATRRIENVGQLTNKGIELMLRANVYRTSDLAVNLTTQFSRNRNEVTDLGGDAFAIGGFGSQWALEGQPLGVYYWRAYARVLDASGNPTDELLLTPDGLPQPERGAQDITDAYGQERQRDAEGQPTGSLLRFVVGDPNPDWTGSLITEVDYKRWGFRMQWDAVQGFEVINWNRRNFDRHNYRGGYDYGLELMDGSTIKKGTANATGSGLILEEYAEDGSFVKLREIQLSYTVSPTVAWMRSVTVTAQGRNLFSFDDYRGYDPEVSIQGRDTGIRGFDFGAVPIPRTLSLGVTLGF